MDWGPEQEVILDRARTHGIEDKIKIIDFQPPETLAAYYVLSRVFVLPSQWEPWGLVVNEAMACAAPVVVSEGAGSSRDLIEEGKTGFTYPPEDTARLAEILDRLMEDDELCEQVGCEGQQKIQYYTPELYGNNLMRALFEL